jgi:hypothetical protein
MGESMQHRSDQLRKAAAECITIAKTTSDAGTRVALITLAQRLCEQARSQSVDFAAIVQDFNERQMVRH